MSTILFLKTSPKEKGSISTELGEYLVNKLTSVSKSTVHKRQLDEEIPFLFEATLFHMFWQAIAQRGAFSLPFQITVFPHTIARAKFHAQTATGKLNADITPTTPSGCHCSIIW